MSSASYVIQDEPVASGLAAWSTSPIWPLFSIMFGGAWLAFSWFVFNAFAFGSPTRYKELMIALSGFVGSVILLVLMGSAGNIGWLDGQAFRYVMITIVVWKLGVAYWLYMLQDPPFQLYLYFNGKARNGVFVLLIGVFLLRPLVMQAFDNVFWQVMIS